MLVYRLRRCYRPDMVYDIPSRSSQCLNRQTGENNDINGTTFLEEFCKLGVHCLGVQIDGCNFFLTDDFRREVNMTINQNEVVVNEDIRILLDILIRQRHVINRATTEPKTFCVMDKRHLDVILIHGTNPDTRK